MASSINASTSGAGGVITTADNTGILQLQTAGVTAVTVNASSALGVGTSPSYGTSGQVLTSAGTGAAPTWSTISAGSMTLLGTVATTSGNSVSLGSLTLTGYTQLQIVWQSIYNNGVGGYSYYLSSDNTQSAGYYSSYNFGSGATFALSGIGNINLTNGSFSVGVGKDTDGSTNSICSGKTNITTATTTIYLRLASTYTFGGGSFLIYGVK
jgi:hypothetical protein